MVQKILIVLQYYFSLGWIFFSPLPALIDHPVGAFLHNVEAPARDAYE